MALHDTDFDNSDRSSPMPASHDMQSGDRPAHGTLSINPVTDATATAAFFQTKNGRGLVNDGSFNRIVLGAEPDGTYGMKVSETGFDVLTTDDSHIIFDSSQSVFKIVFTDTVAITPTNSGASQYTVTRGDSSSIAIPNTLGFIPFVGAFVTTPAGSPVGTTVSEIPFTSYLSGIGNWGLAGLRVYHTISNQYLTFYVDHYSTISYLNPPTYMITYYLLQQTAH